MVTEDSPGQRLEARATPPSALREIYKKYQRIHCDEVPDDEEIVDFDSATCESARRLFTRVASLAPEQLEPLYDHFLNRRGQKQTQVPLPAPVYEAKHLPGLKILPALLPPSTQISLISRLLHRDLSNPRHQTNVHLHYTVPHSTENASNYEPQDSVDTPSLGGKQPEHGSFFSLRETERFLPKDASKHRPLTPLQFFQKKLRWITLGGQYDWSKKEYPPGPPPPFPPDIATLLQGLFPDTRPEAAILNLYSPGDTLSLHRDVSEESDCGLVSVSFGCDGLFVIGESVRSEGLKYTVVRLHSGDVVYMSGPARHMWHGVPRILADTCPEWLQDWPAESVRVESEGEKSRRTFAEWKGWMASKRINLNVRQIRN